MLDEQYRRRLDRITAQLEAEGAPEQDVVATVQDFKSIYDPDARPDESNFRDWYEEQRLKLAASGVDLNPNPDAPEHFYNYRAAFRSGAQPDQAGHWPSKFKLEGHPNLIVNGIDTRTDRQPDWDMFVNPTPYFEEYQQTALAPQRSRQVSAAPTPIAEVPVQNVRAEQMQLQGPQRQPEIMEPMQVKPTSDLKGGLGAALKMDLKQTIAANVKGAARSIRGGLEEPNPVMFNRGRQIVESGIEPQAPEDRIAVQHYKLHTQSKAIEEKTAPIAKQMMDYADELEKSIPEKDRQTIQEAQDWLTTSDALNPANYGRTAAAIGIVSAANGTSNVTAALGMIPVVGAPAAAAGAGSLVNREREAWIDNARAAGLDDEKLLETYGNFYAVPSGVIEYGSSAVMVGPLKALKKSKKFLPFLSKATTQAAKKSIIKSAVGQVLGTAGAAATEGTEEFTQQQLQDGVLWWALTEAAKQNPDKIDQYIQARDKINLPQTTTDAWKSFIVGAAASLPINIVSRLVGGIGGKMRGGKAPADQTQQAPPLSPEEIKAIQSPEAETQKMPVVPGQQRVVKKTVEGITQTYVPGEQGSIIPPQPQEAENVQQKEEGRVQVAPPVEKQEPQARKPSKEEFAALTPDQMVEQYGRLKEESETDQLTGVLNRAGAADRGYLQMKTVEKEGKTTKEPQWLERPDGKSDMIVLDIDNFKKGVNDAYGHETGDRVLSRLGGILINNLEGKADVVRWGGEEIAIIPLQNADRSSILNSVEESRQELHGQSFESEKGILTGVTFSAGYGKNFDTADKAVYEAKQKGKARTFTEEGQYAENDLRPTALVEPRRRAEDTERGTREVETVLPRPQETAAPAREVTPPAEEGRPAGIAPTETSSQTPSKTAADLSEAEWEAKISDIKDRIGKAPTAKAANEIVDEFYKLQEERYGPSNVRKTEITPETAPTKQIGKAINGALKKLPKGARPKIKIITSKAPPAAAQKLAGDKDEWQAAVWYNPEGKTVEVHINENLSPDLYAEALYHEIPGHIGQRLVFADSPAILNTMRQMYGAAKSRGDVDLRGIERVYKSDIEKAGERGDDVLFEEWTAHNLHRYLIENDKASLPRRIYNLFRSALVRIGVVREKIDDVLRSMIKKMSRAKDIGVLDRDVRESFKRPVGEEEKESLVSGKGEEKSVSPGEVNLDIDDETRGQMLRRVITDRYHRLRVLMEAAEKTTGKPLPDELNAYVKNDIINSKIKAKVDDFTEKYINPIMDIAAQNGLDVAQVDQYLYAKHAEEANRVVGERRPDMVEEGLPPSGMSDKEAQQILKAAETSGKKEALERISALVQQWNKARLDMMVEEELLTKEQRAALDKDYKNYVPLKGVDDEETRQELPRTGKGMTVPRREFYLRKGRISKAKDILAHLTQDTIEKSVRGEKNKVLRSLYEFSKKFRNDLITIEPVAYEQIFDKKSGTVETRKRSRFDMKDLNTYGLPVDFKIDGEPMQMLIKDVPLMRAMRTMGADESDTFTKILTKGIMPIQRYMAMVRTQLAINFPIANGLRDTITAQLNAAGLNLPKEQQKGLAWDILTKVPQALKWAYEGQTGVDSEGAKKYKEFVREGGAIEFFGMKDVEQIQKSLVNQLKSMKPGAAAATRRLMRNAYNYITILNGSVENANRLATYTTLRERGLSAQQSASIAKNITVNFNRKGEMGTFLNAWALFANAGIQGSTRIISALIHSRTVQAAAGSILLASIGHAELMRWIMGDDPDDDKNYYDKVTDFVKDTHLLLPYKMLGAKNNGYIRIPLPYGYNIFWAAGQIISKAAHESAKEIPRHALHLLGTVADAFNPIGGAVDLGDPKSILRNFFPTILQPIAELAVNQNFMGGPVYKKIDIPNKTEQETFGPQPVAAHQALKSTPKLLQNITAWANDLTGGSIYRRGAVDVSPDIVKYLWEFTTGGTGKMLTDIASAPFDWIGNKEFPTQFIPILQRFTGEVNEYKDVKILYDNLDKAKRIYEDYEIYKTKDPARAKEIAKEYPGVINLFGKKEGEVFTKEFKTRSGKFVPANRKIVKPLIRMNELKKSLDERGNKEGVKRIEKQIVNHAQRSNRLLEEILKPQR